MATTPAAVRRFAFADLGPAAGLSLVSVLAGLFMPVSPPYRPADAVGLALGALAPLALLWRRRAPLRVLAVAGAAVPLTAALGYAVTTVQWVAWIALFTCFSHTEDLRRRVLAVTLTGLSVGGFALADGGAVGTLDYFGIAMCFGIATVAGDAARSRRIAAAAERVRVVAAAREQAAAADRVLAQERHRLAGELHDALGHAVNVMVMQAGVGRRVFTDNPEFAAQALVHIETVGRDALGELDRLLRVLHPDRAGEPAAEPALTDLAELAGRVRAAGRELVLNPAPVSLSPSGERALFRIAQEAVTNALRHTAAGRITVDIGQTADTVVLEVVNESPPLPAPTPGRGLVNMRERARLEGGLFEAGPVDGGFRVRAALPVAVRS
ncbi:sensor histidine kinase [Catellatospora vulcania]|uniref:sensor histidine kinase n=1 Tax=Catellatospora vulcania TaxID=1460450 RepID=UPI0012D3D2EB|nr:histidine kinase [Catellatospora vulcania]